MTPPGAAAIAVVRLSGSAVHSFLQGHFSRPARPGCSVYGKITDGTRIIDDAVVVLSPDGDWADVNLHGGTWVVRRFLDLARRNRIDLAETTRLPLSGAAVDAVSVLEHEILSHLPMARTELGARVLLGQQTAWDRLKSQREPVTLQTEMERLPRDATLLHLLHPPRVAIVGAANVGKSTLANQLFGQERSITANVPGTTRDWVGDVVNLDGLPVMLVDTPGWRATDDPLERSAIDRSRGEIESAGLVVLVLDATRPLEPEQRSLLDRFAGSLIAVNKCDGQHAWDISAVQAVHTVATTGQGISHLARRIVGHFCTTHPSPDRAYCWTERQQRIVEAALSGKVPLQLDAI